MEESCVQRVELRGFLLVEESGRAIFCHGGLLTEELLSRRVVQRATHCFHWLLKYSILTRCRAVLHSREVFGSSGSGTTMDVDDGRGFFALLGVIFSSIHTGRQRSDVGDGIILERLLPTGRDDLKRCLALKIGLKVTEHIMGDGGGAVNEGETDSCLPGWQEGKNKVVVVRKVNKLCVEPGFS